MNQHSQVVSRSIPTSMRGWLIMKPQESQNVAVTALGHAEVEREVETLIGNIEQKTT